MTRFTCLLLLAAAVLCTPSWAATIVVSNTASISSTGSLRLAIQVANSSQDLDTIVFNIPVTDPGHVYYRDDGFPDSLSLVATTTLPDASITDFDPDYPGTPFSWYRIQLTSALPGLTNPVFINGASQPGASQDPRIQLSGAFTTNAHGFLVNAPGCSIIGFAIDGFTGSGIFLNHDNGTVFQNFLGTDITGSLARGNAVGVTVGGRSNVVGAASITNRHNVVSANSLGILVNGTNAIGNRIGGNYIGTGPNRIGILGNASDGVRIQGGARNTLVGSNFGPRNFIANNSGNGINTLPDSFNTVISDNSIYNNVLLGIDVNNDGVSVADLPTVTSVSYTGSFIDIQGYIQGLANTPYRVELFGNVAVDDSGYGEGERFIGSVNVTTDGSGFTDFSYQNGEASPRGQYVTATATVLPNTASARTTEFSAPAYVNLRVTNTNDAGFGSLRQAIHDANANIGADTILFEVTGTIALQETLPTITDNVYIYGAAGDPTAIVLSGEDSVNILEVDDASLFLIELTIAHGYIDGDGAGLSVNAGGDAQIIRCIFRDNYAEGGRGGAIFSESVLYIYETLFTTNRANNGGAIFSQGYATIDNSTFYRNNAVDFGGALHLENGQLANCTVAANICNTDDSNIGLGGGIYDSNPFTFTKLVNTVVAENTQGSGTPDDISGAFHPNSAANFIGSGRGSTLDNGVHRNQVGPTNSVIDPRLDLLRDNGGPTPTLSPLSNSPLIDMGTNIVALSHDQRGVSRPQGADYDIGAVEFLGDQLSVTTTNDTGPGSLRQAILDANAVGAARNISFDLPGPGPHTILALSPLPDLNAPIILDATTQPGYVDRPIIQLQPGDGVYDGLTVRSSNCVIRGFALSYFGGAAIRISGPTTTQVAIQGNYIGTDLAGTNRQGNGTGIEIENYASRTVINGGNLISGNSTGIYIDETSNTNAIQNNLIGTDITGTRELGNENGIVILGAANGVGGVVQGTRNVISGNGDAGIEISGQFAGLNQVLGNIIGADITGTAVIPVEPSEGLISGVYLGDGAWNNFIGRGDPGAGNLIVVQYGNGINIRNGATLNLIQGNKIGTDITGSYGLGDDSGTGIRVFDAPSNIIGGYEPGEGNLISGNDGDGISLRSGSDYTFILGNFIGTDSTGTEPLPNNGDGIYINTSRNNIGAENAPGARNVIAANNYNGIWLDDPGASNTVSRNFIGVGADGAPLGNGDRGIVVGFEGFEGEDSFGAQAFSGPQGGPANTIRYNSIFANQSLGIDLGYDGVTPNDNGDFDGGPNELQNFPVLTSVLDMGGDVHISGFVSGAAGSMVHIDFYFSAAPDATGFGEGQGYIESRTFTIEQDGETAFEIILSGHTLANSYLTATTTDAQGNTSEFSQAHLIDVPQPPVIVTGPGSTNAPANSTVVFCVTASGSPPLQYQWRRNGVAMADETNSCLTLDRVQVTDGGEYTVVVANIYGAVTSDPAVLTIAVPQTPPGDNFSARVTISGAQGVATGTNNFATLEPGEPLHAGKLGGRSVWYTWQAPFSGVATFRTVGSTFDTLLGIYTGSTVSSLSLEASDEDSGDALTSQVQFNVVAGQFYHIAIDGFGDAAGYFVLTWLLEAGQTPEIVVPPQSATVGRGTNYTFNVIATGTGLTYQWFLNGNLLSQTTSFLTITNVQDTNVGQYVVRVHGSGRFIDSVPASLQINVTGMEVQSVLTMDKFLDAVNSEPLRLGGAGGGAGGGSRLVRRDGSGGGGALARSYSGTQTINTFGSKSQAGEPNHCGVVGGASQWFTYMAEEPGALYLNTEGSNFDTVLAVYTGTGLNFSSLQSVACDNDSGAGLTSSLIAPVDTGIAYFIAVDGVNKATGILQLNFTLVTPASLLALGVDPSGGSRLRVIGRVDMKFTLQRSSDFTTWVDLFTTNSPTATLDFTDPLGAGGGLRIYRARMLP